MKIVLGILAAFVGIVVLILFGIFSPWILAGFRNTFIPKPVATTADLPWVAPGKQARYFRKQVAGYNTGVQHHRWWGSSFRRSEDPAQTAYRAFAFLENRRAMTDWPRSLSGDSGTFTHPSVYDEVLPTDQRETNFYGTEIFTYIIRVAPYRFHLVSLKPTVVVLQPKPELLDWWQDYLDSDFARESRWITWVGSQPEQQVLSPLIWLQNPVEFGTMLAAEHPEKVDGWMWFSPDLAQTLTPLPLSRTSTAEIQLERGRLAFEPSGEGWRVVRE